jgi:hypothetical protein
MTQQISYKFKELETLQIIKAYVDSTYGGHYCGDIQPTELIISSGKGEGFCVGNIIKYATRYGKKQETSTKADLLKIIHYSMILLSTIDAESSGGTCPSSDIPLCTEKHTTKTCGKCDKG